MPGLKLQLILILLSSVLAPRQSNFATMPNFIRDIQKTDTTSFPYIFEQNVTVRTKVAGGLIRCNVYRPKTDARFPVIVTYGPYGKDIHYEM